MGRHLKQEQRVPRVKELVRGLIEAMADVGDILIVLHLQTGTAKRGNEPGSWVLANLIWRLCKQLSPTVRRVCVWL